MQAEAERATGLIRYPEDWRDTTLESVVEINPESLGTQTPATFQFRYIDIASVTFGVIDWSSVKTHHFATAPSRARRVVRPGDVLLSTVRPGLQAHAYADWNQEDGYVCSTGFAVLRRGRAIWPRFLYHLAFSDVIASQVRRLEVGSNYPAITESDVRWLRIPQPPLPEQRQIAEILDTADRAIGETEALLSKLKQTKTGLMHDLLTRGLDERGQLRVPDAHPEQFKDSPLGRIPREWEVSRLSEVVPRAEYGVSVSLNDETGIPVLRMNNIRDGEADLSEIKTSASEEARNLRLKPLDVLFNRTNSMEHVGRTGIWRDQFSQASFASYLVRLVPNTSRLNPEYLNLWLNLPETQIRIRRVATPGVQQVNINPTNLRKEIIALPNTLAEQERVVETLAAHDARIRAEEAYRDKLKLQKKGLMEDLLTGRVRVKTAQEVGA